MTMKIDWDSPEVFQLKECYDLAARFAKLDTVREVLREKSKKIDQSANSVPTPDNSTCPRSEMQPLSRAVYALTLEGFAANDNGRFVYEPIMASLPDSAEKEFVLALLSLRDGTDETHRLEAIKHIRAANSLAPNDPRYIALANILFEADR